MERIYELEREHVEVYGELLKALDKLYLVQRGYVGTRDKDNETILATRRQLQMSIEKSAAIIRTLERRLKSKHTQGVDLDSTEDILASRLAKLMHDNYEMDYKVTGLLERETQVRQELEEERIRYSKLVGRLRQLSDEINGEKPSNEDIPETRSENETPKRGNVDIVSENERIEQLLLALKIHGGYDPLM